MSDTTPYARKNVDSFASFLISLFTIAYSPH